VVYEMLAGHPPFMAANIAELLGKQLTTAPPPLGESNAELPVHLDAVLRRALAPAPGDRFPSVSSFAEALRAAESSQPAPYSPSASVETSKPAAYPAGRARQAIVGTIALATLATAGFLAVGRTTSRLTPSSPPSVSASVPAPVPTRTLALALPAPVPETAAGQPVVPEAPAKASATRVTSSRRVITLDSQPAGASVCSARSLQVMGLTPFRFKAARSQRIFIHKPGYRPAEITVTPSHGSPYNVTLDRLGPEELEDPPCAAGVNKP
jgi:serine/threonine protein kinase